MPQVDTVTGPIDADQLGLTLVHEHPRVRSEVVAFQFPHLYDEEAELRVAVEWGNAAKSHGVKTIVDPSIMDLGRDIRFTKQVAEETGLNVVPATGIYGWHYEKLPHHFQTRDVDYMADAFVHDLEQGIQGTEIKAAFVKCAVDEPGFTEDVEKVCRAAARAATRTGKPLMAHSHPGSETGLRQVEIFVEEGVEPSRVQIAHTGDSADVDYIERLLEKGPFIGMDRYGLDMILPTDQRNQTVVELAKRGHAERMMLSQDACAAFDWFPPEMRPELAPNWTFTYVFEEVIPALKDAGVTDEQVTAMMETAPRRWLAGE